MTKRVLLSIALLAGLLHAAIAQEVTSKGPELDKSKDYYAVLDTSFGKIVVSFFEDEAPETVRNFVNLAEGTKAFKDPAKRETKGYYDGTVFHRVINDFMLQGGDPTATGSGSPGFNIKGEVAPSLKFSNKDCLMAMANAGHPDTAGAQFFITDVGAKPGWLDGGYAIFGEVVEGRDVVKTICEVPVKAQPRGREVSRPIEDVALKTVTIIRVPKGSDEWKKALEAPAAAATEEVPAPEAAESEAPAKAEPASQPAVKPESAPAKP
ncbi:MAG: peptidyl-prolyl cis-trans isomerase [Candidatus Sumerlaeota bacterium]|nr:peptidyl-prolyl cis-trans isomerase [Candidatus Sumerlaeota bacterium]